MTLGRPRVGYCWCGLRRVGRCRRVAELSGLTVETLRHYHQVGLFVPVQVDDRTGYRRYGLRQLPRARTLAALRDVGMPLEDVAAIVDATDQGARRARLVEHRRRLTEAARQAAGRVDAMDRMIEREDVMESPLRIEEGTPMLSDERLAGNYWERLTEPTSVTLVSATRAKCVTATSTATFAPS